MLRNELKAICVEAGDTLLLNRQMNLGGFNGLPVLLPSRYVTDITSTMSGPRLRF